MFVFDSSLGNQSSCPATVITIKLRVSFFFPSYFPAQYRLANYKALAEHKEQQLRKLKEELRRVQQDQDVTGKVKINIWHSFMLNIQF